MDFLAKDYTLRNFMGHECVVKVRPPKWSEKRVLESIRYEGAVTVQRLFVESRDSGTDTITPEEYMDLQFSASRGDEKAKSELDKIDGARSAIREVTAMNAFRRAQKVSELFVSFEDVGSDGEYRFKRLSSGLPVRNEDDDWRDWIVENFHEAVDALYGLLTQDQPPEFKFAEQVQKRVSGELAKN